MGELDGIRALVTGGAAGIGLAVAGQLAAAGAAVVVLDLRCDLALPRGVGFAAADVTDDAAVREAVDLVANRLGGLDVVVNNAGIGARGSVEQSTDEEWLRVLDVNAIGPARVCRAAWPHLRRSPNASVINICSIAATAGLPQRAVYSASKGALLSLSLAMAADGVQDGIRVNAVNPGTVDTSWVARLLDQADDPSGELTALQHRQPHGRLVTAEEVAHAVVYLASPRAGSTTGAEIAVDGGMRGVRVNRP